MIKNKEAWCSFKRFASVSQGYDEFDFFYDIKTNKYFVSYYPDFRYYFIEEYQIFIGYFSNKCIESNFYKVLDQVKYKYSLYSVSDLLPHIKKEVCNGAGPRGFGWSIPDFKFTDAANHHDLMYTLGGNKKDKQWADLVFLWNMKRDGADWLANVYYWNVKTFGNKAFEKREVKMSLTQLNECKF